MRTAAAAAGVLIGTSLALAAPAQGRCTALMPGKAPASRHPIAPADLIELRQIGFPDAALSGPSPLAVSPDGRSVAFQLSRPDLAANDYCNGLVVVPLDGSGPPRLVDQGGEFDPAIAFVRGGEINVGLPRPVTPAWSADGRKLAYLRRERGITQAFIASADGYGGQRITQSDADIETVSWTADGTGLLVSTRPNAPVARAAIDREGRSGWLYDRRVATNQGFRPRLPEAEAPLKRFVVDSHGAPWRAASGRDQPLAQAARSPAGWSTALRPEGASLVAPSRLWATAPDGREVRCAADACLGRIAGLWWDRKGTSFRFLRREGWNRELTAFYRWAPGATAPVRTWVTSDALGNCVQAAERLVCTAENATTPRRIVSIDPETGKRRPVFDPNPEFAGVQLGKVQRLRWRNDRGLEAWGDLVLPPGTRPGAKLPMIVVQYHSRGFLRGGTGDEYPIYLFAAHGFAVLSIERPPDVTESIPNLKTIAELDAASEAGWAERRSMHSALMAGLEAAIRTGYVDPARIGITGLSDGATAARFALINSNAFAAAAISSCCIEPRTSMTYGGIAWAEFNRSVGYPPAAVDVPGFWRPVSVVLNADRIKAPLLMQLSDDEALLGLEAFEALREHDAPVELYVFPDEHHVKWQPAHRLAIYERNLDWFDFWLRCREDPSPAKVDQYRRWRAMRPRSAIAALCRPASP